MLKNIFFILYFIIFSIFITECVKKEHIILEHATLLYYNANYLNNVTVTVQRLNRSNNRYYLTINFQLLKHLDGKYLQLHFYVYKMYSTNVYTRTNFEMHIQLCDFIERDKLFSRPFQEAYARNPEKERPMPILKCPLLPGLYKFTNLAFSSNKFITGAPIREGRIYYNSTDKNTVLSAGYIDFQL